MDRILNKVHAEREFFNHLGNAYPADDRVNFTSEPIEDVTYYWFNLMKIILLCICTEVPML